MTISILTILLKKPYSRLICVRKYTFKLTPRNLSAQYQEINEQKKI